MRRICWLAFGVLILQLGFIASYVAAFHQPTPRDIPIAVVAEQGLPADIAVDTAARLNAIDGAPLAARTATPARPALCFVTVRSSAPTS